MAELFEIEGSQSQLREVIKVIGVGGGGGNALNHIVERCDWRGVHRRQHWSLYRSLRPTSRSCWQELTKGPGAARPRDRDEVRRRIHR